jgi:hypothetical protein
MRARAEQPGKHRRTEGAVVVLPTAQDKKHSDHGTDVTTAHSVNLIDNDSGKKSSRKRERREAEVGGGRVDYEDEHNEEEANDRGKKKKKKSKRAKNSNDSP